MFKRILVPVDGSSASNHALELARGLARQQGGELRILHVLDETAYLTGYDPSAAASGALYDAVRSSATRMVQEAAAASGEQGVAAEAVLFDSPGIRLGEAVAEVATNWKADLIVVGTHGRRGPSRLLLGSGAEQIIRMAPVPVLVTRADAAAP